MSDNETTTNPPVVQPVEPPVVQPPVAPINPLLDAIKMPGETFRLPSGGIFYKNGEIDATSSNGEVHIYPMTALDEIVFKSPDKLFSGEAVREVISRCVPQVPNPMMLLAKDIDFIMVCLRKISYGEQIESDYIHTCENAESHTYKIQVGDFINKSKKIDPTTVSANYTTMLDTGQTVTLRPMVFKDVIDMLQSPDDVDMDPVELQSRLVKNLISVIESVDGITDQAMISEWLVRIKVKTIRDLSMSLEQVGDWGPEFTHEAVCEDCGEAIHITIPLNPISFFT